MPGRRLICSNPQCTGRERSVDMSAENLPREAHVEVSFSTALARTRVLVRPSALALRTPRARGVRRASAEGRTRTRVRARAVEKLTSTCASLGKFSADMSTDRSRPVHCGFEHIKRLPGTPPSSRHDGPPHQCVGGVWRPKAGALDAAPWLPPGITCDVY